MMPSTPFTCCSIGKATASMTVRALAPGERVVTCTVGGRTSGYCATGRANSATIPITTIRMASTLARTGRRMKKSEIMIAGRYLAAPAAGAGGAAMVCIRVDLLARYRSQDTSDDDAIAAFDPAFDRPQV